MNSVGEYKIRQILEENNIEYIHDMKFPTCKFPDTGYPARFDFYLPAYNLLIEYDGI